MPILQEDTIVIDQQTSKLQAFRLEDTNRAPAVILFVDDCEPELFPLAQGTVIPSKIRSHNMEEDIQVITYSEINKFLV